MLLLYQDVKYCVVLRKQYDYAFQEQYIQDYLEYTVVIYRKSYLRNLLSAELSLMSYHTFLSICDGVLSPKCSSSRSFRNFFLEESEIHFKISFLIDEYVAYAGGAVIYCNYSVNDDGIELK